MSRVASFWDQTVAEVYELYQRKLFSSNAVDFDDILMLTVDVLERFPEALERWQSSFRHVLVDEYQDTNHAQYRLLRLLAAKHRNVFAVGDPDQSIYGFRGADIRNILDFEKDFGGADIVALEQNYRSTNAILEAANSVIDNNRDRKPKRLWSELGAGDPVEVVEVEDEHAEARFVARRDRAARGGLLRLGDGGLLPDECPVPRPRRRARAPAGAYQVIGGPRFCRRRDQGRRRYLSHQQPGRRSRVVGRIANRPRRGIRSTTVQRLVSHAGARDLALGRDRGSGGGQGRDGRRPAIRGFRTIVESLMSAAQELEIDELVEASPRGRGRSGHEAERTIEARGRIENLSELVGSAQEFRARVGDPTLAGFLEEVQLQSDQDTLASDTAQVTLMTIHNAKGLEYRVVFLIGMEEDLPALPLDRGQRGRGGAAARLRGHDARDGAAHHDPRPLGRSTGGVSTTSAPASSTSCRRRSCASGCGRPRGRVTPSRSGRSHPATSARYPRSPPATPCVTARSARK